MKWKMFTTERNPSPPKLASLFRFLRDSQPGDSLPSSPINQPDDPSKTGFNLNAHRITHQRIHELEVRKAMAASMMRHQPLF